MRKSRPEKPSSNPQKSVISEQLTRFMKLTSPSPQAIHPLPPKPVPKAPICIDNPSDDERPRNSVPLPLAQDSMGLAGIRAKMENLKVLASKKGKPLEMRVMIEDLRLRLIQKGFFEYLKEKVRAKKQSEGRSRLFFRSRGIAIMKAVFRTLKENLDQKTKVREFIRELQLRDSEKILRKAWLRLKAYWGKKKQVWMKKAELEENALKMGVCYVFGRLKENCGLLKKMRLFGESRKHREKIGVFNALKKSKVSLSEVKEFLSRDWDFIGNFSIKARIRRGFHREINKLKNGQKTLKIQVKMLQKPLKLGALKGKFNAEEIRRIIERKVAENIKKRAFYLMKIGFLEGKKTRTALIFHEIRVKSKVLKILAENRGWEKERGRKALAYCLLRRWAGFFRVSRSKLAKRVLRLRSFYLARSFALLRKYTHFKRNKRGCLNAISQAFHRKLASKILNRWLVVSRASQPLRELYRASLKKRMLRRLREIFLKRAALKRVLSLIAEQPPKPVVSRENFLRNLFKSWRGLVIDSENTKSQRVHNFMALNHFTTSLKVKAFNRWSSLLDRKAALGKLLSVLSRSLNLSIIQKWRTLCAFEARREGILRGKLLDNRMRKGFEMWKSWFLKRKIARLFYLRSVFEGWERKTRFSRVYWPKKIYQMNLMRKSFGTLRLRVLKAGKKAEISNFIGKFRFKCLAKALFKQMVIRVRRVKNQEFLALKHRFNITRTVFNFLLTRVYKSKLRKKQERLALKFFQRRVRKPSSVSSAQLDEILLFKAFSALKTMVLRRKAFQGICNKFAALRARKTKRKYIGKWVEKLRERRKPKGTRKKEESLYNIDLEKYKGLSKSFERLGESNNFAKSGNNDRSYASWLRQYEENEKYMEMMLGGNGN